MDYPLASLAALTFATALLTVPSPASAVEAPNAARVRSVLAEGDPCQEDRLRVLREQDFELTNERELLAPYADPTYPQAPAQTATVADVVRQLEEAQRQLRSATAKCASGLGADPQSIFDRGSTSFRGAKFGQPSAVVGGASIPLPGLGDMNCGLAPGEERTDPRVSFLYCSNPASDFSLGVMAVAGQELGVPIALKVTSGLGVPMTEVIDGRAPTHPDRLFSGGVWEDDVFRVVVVSSEGSQRSSWLTLVYVTPSLFGLTRSDFGGIPWGTPFYSTGFRQTVPSSWDQGTLCYPDSMPGGDPSTVAVEFCFEGGILVTGKLIVSDGQPLFEMANWVMHRVGRTAAEAFEHSRLGTLTLWRGSGSKLMLADGHVGTAIYVGPVDEPSAVVDGQRLSTVLSEHGSWLAGAGHGDAAERVAGQRSSVTKPDPPEPSVSEPTRAPVAARAPEPLSPAPQPTATPTSQPTATPTTPSFSRAARVAEVERLWQEGFAAMKAKRIDEALDKYQAALALDPNHVATLVEIGWAFYVLGRWSDVVASWERLLEIDPSHEVATWLPEARAKLPPGGRGQARPPNGRGQAPPSTEVEGAVHQPARKTARPDDHADVVWSTPLAVTGGELIPGTVAFLSVRCAQSTMGAVPGMFLSLPPQAVTYGEKYYFRASFQRVDTGPSFELRHVVEQLPMDAVELPVSLATLDEPSLLVRINVTRDEPRERLPEITFLIQELAGLRSGQSACLNLPMVDSVRAPSGPGGRETLQLPFERTWMRSVNDFGRFELQLRPGNKESGVLLVVKHGDTPADMYVQFPDRSEPAELLIRPLHRNGLGYQDGARTVGRQIPLMGLLNMNTGGTYRFVVIDSRDPTVRKKFDMPLVYDVRGLWRELWRP